MSDENQEGALGIIVEQDVPIPMRDGVILRANVFRPEAPGRYPGLLMRTPYGKPVGGQERLVRAGYAVVTQDSRGRYASDGTYVPFTVPDNGEAEDGFDSVEWLAQQPWCNSRVGTFGTSYPAWMQWQLAKLRPPHLVAMCACSIPLEMTDVDWSGGFKPGRRVQWWFTGMAPDLRRRHGLPPPHTPEEARRIWNEVEHARWLGFLPWAELPRYLPPGLAEHVKAWFRNPAIRAWGFDGIHSEVGVPNLDFTGWYDHCNGTMLHLAAMQRTGRTETARKGTRLVIGPWNHPGIGQRTVGDVDFGPQAELDRTDMMIRWFDHWLKGHDNGVDREMPVRYFVMGANKWRSAGTWPPEDGADTVYHLSSRGDARGVDATGLLTGDVPSDEPCDTFTYDAKDPVPTLWTEALFTVPSDRRILENRQDILYYRTPPLQEGAEVVGYPEMVLFASSSAPDTDFFARLVDEHPDGPAFEVCYGMVRARHRRSLDHEDLLTPDEVTEFHIRLGPTGIRFLKGHRIRLEITSSDFPNHDRNHNTGRNDLTDNELGIAHQKVFHSPPYPSRLILPTHT